MATYPYSTSAFVVKQPLGDFYVANIPAEVLLDVCYSHRLKAVKNSSGTYRLEGSQRLQFEPRLKAVGKFLNTVEAALPNAIILAANYLQDSDEVEQREEFAWNLSLKQKSSCATLTIPTQEKLAAVIDGQHRLFGFHYARVENLTIPLVCAIFFDLPKPYQAQLFATINSTQKPVSKSQTYELFGYNVEDEPEKSWTPDKLAVFLTRKLNLEETSPFYRHIRIAAENDITQTIAEARRAGFWMVSTATVVEGILRLITGNAKEDNYVMHDSSWIGSRSRSTLKVAGNSPPLRQHFIDENDTVIYTIVSNFFRAVMDILWTKPDNGFIQRTVGIQALFDLLKRLTPKALKDKNLSEKYFAAILLPAKSIDFSNNFFHASGAGRTRIRNCLTIALQMTSLVDIPDPTEKKIYAKLTAQEEA
jgi:DNA phosphorothioation-associated DGQHR protein 1